MKQYIIDGNNVIGKMPQLKQLQKKDPQSSRERLAFQLDRFFGGKKYKVHLHFDGHPKDPIRTSKVKLIYSYNAAADTKIRRQIENSKNPKNLIVVTSDRPLAEFAKVCSCETESSENFVKRVEESQDYDKEEEIIKNISDDEIKRMFDAE